MYVQYNFKIYILKKKKKKKRSLTFGIEERKRERKE
jgi:hypothetical protein